MSKEAMKLALEAMRGVIAWHIMRNHMVPYRVRDPLQEAITAISEALAEQPAQQEPVAWWNPTKDSVSTDPVHRHNKDCQPLYTSPPAQRTWVGLTDEEIEKVWRRVQANDFHDCVQPFARAIEAAHGIKENT